ncbi:MAG: SpoIIE family protein phosphatase [Oscillatoriophycideae cyanobacterium NC_groundwater_1537_Pr4_S-0.65um_50_18]|nr:SpoIIE family protein phosphatase [Oscillatoriophycideae cyanobacterium NC_groundwater_1537_Pr4_S-0.65um_50_18]
MGELNGRKLKLMVVDDESHNLDLLYRTFRQDFEIYKADSAANAIQILEQVGEMAIIISDQRMPKMSGTEFLGRTVERFPDTIRILLTAYTDVEDLVGAINAGKVFKYITKPWTPAELKVTIQQAAETYQVLKRRTNELRRALRRESLFNTITTAIRESLDYDNMLQRVVETIGQAFEADICALCPLERTEGESTLPYRFSSELFTYSAIAPLSSATHSSSGTSSTGSPNPHLPNPHLKDQEQLGFDTLALEQFSQCSTPQVVQAQVSNQTQLKVPLTYQKEMLALLMLHRSADAELWTVEDSQLLSGVAEQAALALSQAKLYQQIQEQSAQMQSELAVARQIQTNLLRQSLPQLENVIVQALCFPARQVGGDFFEVYVHPQGDIWLAVGDVSGKGVPAALFMASGISLLRRELAQEISPEPHEVMHHLNQSLWEDLVSSNCFITLVLARYTPSSGNLSYANAGHIYPMVWSRQHERSLHSIETQDTQELAEAHSEPEYLKVRGVPLGILPHWKATSGNLHLATGDIFLLTSDGITEATIPQVSTEDHSSGAMLQQSGLWQMVLQQQDRLDLNRLLADIQAHNSIQEDDQTMLSLEVL